MVVLISDKISHLVYILVSFPLLCMYKSRPMCLIRPLTKQQLSALNSLIYLTSQPP